MKKLKKVVATILIISMALTSKAFFTFANGTNNVVDNSETEVSKEDIEVYGIKVKVPMQVSRRGGGGNPSGGGGSSSGGASDPTKGPMGDLTKNPLYNFNLNTVNNIPQNKMVTNPALAVSLLSNAENVGRIDNNVADTSGNAGIGKWQKLQGTNNWYFIVGNATDGNFLSNNWFNISSNGVSGWYHFDSNGLMQTGWFNENGKLYYFNENPIDTNYGKAVVGTAIINGTTYNFDSTGALIS